MLVARSSRIVILMSIAYATLAAQATPLLAQNAANNEPVVIQADQMDYDNRSGMVIAQGKVEVTQKDQVLLADMLTYDRANNLVFAQGNVTVMEPDGNVYFADEVELTDDMKQGVSTYFKARMADNSLIAANEAVRVNEATTELYKAVYSPCSIVCKEGGTKTPTWQIRADKATIDRNEEEIRYNHVKLDMWGVPVLYSPYLAHALPGAPNETGFLMPSFSQNNNLGTVIRVPFYYVFDQTHDLTLTPVHTSLEGPVLFGEYRQKFNFGEMKLYASGTQTDSVNANGTRDKGNTFRGHFFGEGDFILSDSWNAGFNIRRTSDDTYLRKYDISGEPLLTSRIYTEKFNLASTARRSFAVAEGLSFQGLQQQDDRRKSPLVLPSVDLFYESNPLIYNSRVSLAGNVMALTRDLGTNMQRLSMIGKWMLPYITGGGHVFEVSTQLRTDGYLVQDLALGTNRTFDGFKGRVVPQLQIDWRYPLVKRFENASLVVEPVVNAIASPSVGNYAKIPNEDSAVPEFTDSNLFSDNRFAGLDRLETGPRINYGLRSQLQVGLRTQVDAVFGQAYRLSDDPLFPISNDLNSQFSDFVGRVGFNYQPLEFIYRFRLDKDDFEPKRQEAEVNLLLNRFTVAVNYLSIRNDPILTSKQELSTGTAIRLTDTLTLSGAINRDMLRGSFTSANTSLTFANECLTSQIALTRDLTSDRDFKQSTSVTVQVLFKNL